MIAPTELLVTHVLVSASARQATQEISVNEV